MYMMMTEMALGGLCYVIPTTGGEIQSALLSTPFLALMEPLSLYGACSARWLSNDWACAPEHYEYEYGLLSGPKVKLHPAKELITWKLRLCISEATPTPAPSFASRLTTIIL